MTDPTQNELRQLGDGAGEPEPDSPWRARAIEAFEQLKPRTSSRVQRNAQVKLMANGRRFALTFEYPDDDDAWHFGPIFEVVSDRHGERLVLRSSHGLSATGAE
jgi:predicted phosphohydrolase